MTAKKKPAEPASKSTSKRPAKASQPQRSSKKVHGPSAEAAAQDVLSGEAAFPQDTAWWISTSGPGAPWTYWARDCDGNTVRGERDTVHEAHGAAVDYALRDPSKEEGQ